MPALLQLISCCRNVPTLQKPSCHIYGNVKKDKKKIQPTGVGCCRVLSWPDNSLPGTTQNLYFIRDLQAAVLEFEYFNDLLCCPGMNIMFSCSLFAISVNGFNDGYG